MKKVNELTDRELKEESYKRLKSIDKNLYSISIWFQLWSWIAAISIVVWLIFLFANN